MHKPKLIYITTVPISLFFLLKEQLRFMNEYYEVKGVSSEHEGGLRLAAEKNEEVEIVLIEMTRTISPFKVTKLAWSLYKLLLAKVAPMV